MFNASNVLDAEALLEGAARTFELARELVEAGMKLSWLDIGGGLGISYAADGVELDVERFGAGLSELLADLREDTGLPVRLVLEPGRYLVGPAGRYVTRIVDQKSCASVDFLVVDGGVHHLLRPALVGQAHPIRPVGAHASAALRPQRVVGPLCTSLDSFGDHDLPTLDVGELVAVEACGAYGFTEAMPGFLSHAVPAELMVWRGEAHVLRERKEVEAHLEGQSIPAGLREASAS